MRFRKLIALVSIPIGFILAGCTSPISAERVTTRQAYARVEANALRTGQPSVQTRSMLHRFNLSAPAANRPGEAILRFHQESVSSI